ncbi:MAG: lasso peptide biosynthesis B2 protein [Acidobacteria bacterium]|nr:MAG: lasso peptide biosynthesis B2 protein [Acidobacteriota bacterium]
MRFVLLGMEVLAIALQVEIALRRRPLERVFADASQARARGRLASDIAPATLDRAIRTAYRVLPFEPTCLKHALIFCRVRRRRGLSAELRIGVQKEDGVFGAHAWVEDGAGNVLTDPLEGFSPLPLRRASTPDQRASD